MSMEAIDPKVNNITSNESTTDSHDYLPLIYNRARTRLLISSNALTPLEFTSLIKTNQKNCHLT